MVLRVLIVQHAEKERLPGDPGLTDRGRTRARATARWLGRGDTPIAIWSSPMRRARETTIPIAEEFGLPPSVDHRLRERMNWDDPDAESLEDFLDDWRAASADRFHIPRSGDSSFDATARFFTALNDLAAAHSNGTIIVIAHGGVTTDALRTLLGDDALHTRAPTLIDHGVPCCAITTLSATHDGWAVTAIADTQHLDDTFCDPPT